MAKWQYSWLYAIFPAPLVELGIEGLWIYEVTRNMTLYQCIKLFSYTIKLNLKVLRDICGE